MKILQVINSLGTGGAEKLLLDTVPIYRKMGLQMDVLLLWNNEHQFTKALQEMNICKIFILNNSSSINDIYKPVNILKIKKIMRDYDVIHVHLFPAQYFAVLANQLNSNRSKLIFTEHSTSNRRISNFIFKPIESWFYKRFSTTVCITEEIKMIYDSYLGLQKKTKVIENGVDLEKIKNASGFAEKKLIHPDLRETDKLIIQVSSMHYPKDQDTVIKSIILLPENYKLLLVGDGERRKELENLVLENKLETRVFFLGQRLDVPKLLKSVDVIVLSSRYEGLSLSSIEGLASGKPFVASDVKGLSQVVTGAGVLFKSGDEKELAKIITSLTNNPGYANDIANKGYERALQFDIHKMVQKHIELYETVDSLK